MSERTWGKGTILRNVEFREILDCAFRRRAGLRLIARREVAPSALKSRWIYVFRFENLGGRPVLESELRADEEGKLSCLPGKTCLAHDAKERPPGSALGGTAVPLLTVRNDYPVLFLFIPSPIRLARASLRRICRSELRSGDPWMVHLNEAVLQPVDLTGESQDASGSIVVNVLDPVSLAMRLARVYQKAVEAQQTYEGQTATSRAKEKALERNLKYSLASVIHALLAQSSGEQKRDLEQCLKSDWTGNSKLHEQFRLEYEAKTKHLHTEREQAARRLVDLLGSRELALWETFYSDRSAEGDDTAYGRWLEVSAFSHQRLSESMLGQRYLAEPGPAMTKALREYLFPEDGIGEHLGTCKTYVEAFATLWSEFLPWAAAPGRKVPSWRLIPKAPGAMRNHLRAMRDLGAETLLVWGAIDHFNSVVGAELVTWSNLPPPRSIEIKINADAKVTDALKESIERYQKAERQSVALKKEWDATLNEVEKWKKKIDDFSSGTPRQSALSSRVSALLEKTGKALTALIAVQRLVDVTSKRPVSRSLKDKLDLVSALNDVTKDLIVQPMKEALEKEANFFAAAARSSSAEGFLVEGASVRVGMKGMSKQSALRIASRSLLVAGILIELAGTLLEVKENLDDGEIDSAILSGVKGAGAVSVTILSALGALNPLAALVAAAAIFALGSLLDSRKRSKLQLTLAHCCFGTEFGKPGAPEWAEGAFETWTKGVDGITKQLITLLRLGCTFSVKAQGVAAVVVTLDFWVPGLELVVEFAENRGGEVLRSTARIKPAERSWKVKGAAPLLDATEVGFNATGAVREIVFRGDTRIRHESEVAATWVVIGWSYAIGAEKLAIPSSLKGISERDRENYQGISEKADLKGVSYAVFGRPRGLNPETSSSINP